MVEGGDVAMQQQEELGKLSVGDQQDLVEFDDVREGRTIKQ